MIHKLKSMTNKKFPRKVFDFNCIRGDLVAPKIGSVEQFTDREAENHNYQLGLYSRCMNRESATFDSWMNNARAWLIIKAERRRRRKIHSVADKAIDVRTCASKQLESWRRDRGFFSSEHFTCDVSSPLSDSGRGIFTHSRFCRLSSSFLLSPTYCTNRKRSFSSRWNRFQL